jgi:hypothetical protein
VRLTFLRLICAHRGPTVYHRLRKKHLVCEFFPRARFSRARLAKFEKSLAAQFATAARLYARLLHLGLVLSTLRAIMLFFSSRPSRRRTGRAHVDMTLEYTQADREAQERAVRELQARVRGSVVEMWKGALRRNSDLN